MSDSCDPHGCRLPGSSVHGILQARILEWVAVPSSGDLPNPGIEPGFTTLQANFFILTYNVMYSEKMYHVYFGF